MTQTPPAAIAPRLTQNLIRTNKGKLFALDVDLLITAWDLKVLLQDHPETEKIPGNLTRLCLFSAELRNSQSLVKQGMSKNDMVIQRMRLPGGAKIGRSLMGLRVKISPPRFHKRQPALNFLTSPLDPHHREPEPPYLVRTRFTSSAQIFIRTTKGIFPLEVERTMTGEDLKEILASHPRSDKIPGYLTRLLLNTSDLMDASSHGQQGIRPGSIVTQVMRLPGGADRIGNGTRDDDDDFMDAAEALPDISDDLRKKIESHLNFPNLLGWEGAKRPM